MDKVTREQLIARLKEALPLLLEGKATAAAYLYGSLAQGTSTPFSDIDIALVVFDRDVTPRQRLQLQLQLSAALAAMGIAEADVRIVNDAPLLLRGQVTSQGILLYSGDEAARVEFETRTREEYFGFQPFAARLREAYFTDLRQRGLHGQRGKS